MFQLIRTRSHVKHWTELRSFPSNMAEMMLTNWTGGFCRAINRHHQQNINALWPDVASCQLMLRNLVNGQCPSENG